MYEKNNIGLCLAALDLIKRGGTYAEKDCQGFVEEALKNCGVDRRDYSGSNHMIREMVHSVKAIDTAMRPGDLVFWVRNNNQEGERYKLGGDRYVEAFAGWNVSHVGVYLGSDRIAESASSIGHWAVTELKKRKPTHYAKHKNLSYVEGGEDLILSALNSAESHNIKSDMPREQGNLRYVERNAKYSGSFLALREKPDTGARLLAEMVTGSEVLVIQERKDRWSEVLFNGQRGFCRTGGLSAKKPEQLDLDKNTITLDMDDWHRVLAEIQELKERTVELENRLGMGVG